MEKVVMMMLEALKRSKVKLSPMEVLSLVEASGNNEAVTVVLVCLASAVLSPIEKLQIMEEAEDEQADTKPKN